MGQVVFHRVEKYADGARILGPLDLCVEAKELLVLLGPSGSGKSTALRLIAGLETPSTGTISIDNVDVTHRPPKDRDVSMVFQNYALYPHLSVRENLGFGLKMRGRPKPEVRRLTDDVAKMLDISDLLGRRPNSLSGGQMQRVAIGRAIVRRPKVFLLDEPLSNLDAALRTRMRREIAELHQSLKTTMIYVTHDQTEAMALASRIVILKEGQIEQVGAPREVYARPQSAFVGRFLGTPEMNQVLGQIREGPCFESHGLQLKLPNEAHEYVGRERVLGFRPEAVQVSGDGDLEGEVVGVEPAGPLVYVRMGLPGGLVVTGNAHADFGAKTGDRVRFTLDDHGLHYFAPE